MAQHFLDKTGLSDYSNSIASILKAKLGSKADKSEVITIDYVNDNFVDKNTYNDDQSTVWTSINSKIGSDYAYSKSEVNTLLAGYMPRSAGTEYVTVNYLNTEGYAKQSWVNSTISSALSGYATQAWVNNQGYATQAWVLEQIPDISDYYTIEQITDLLSGYATTTTVNNISSQLTILSNTVDQYIANGSSGGSSDMVDLNNIYYWVHLAPKQLVFHSGDTSPVDDPTPYHRSFVTTDMYRRNQTSFSLSNYETWIGADVIINNISHNISGLHYDFSSSTVLSTYCDQTVKKYLNNEVVINNEGVFTSSLTSLFTASSWNVYISQFKENYYKDINDGYNNHIGYQDTGTWVGEDESEGWNDLQSYHPIIHDEESLAGRYLCIYNLLNEESDPDKIAMLSDPDKIAMLQARLDYLANYIYIDVYTGTLTADYIHSLIEYLIIDSSKTIFGTITVSIWPFNKVNTETPNPDDASDWDKSRYTCLFNYKANTWDDVDTRQLELELYQNAGNEWVTDTAANSSILTIYNTSGYYNQLKTNNSSYLNGQKYVYASIQKKDSDQKYYLTYGEGLSKVAILKSKFIEAISAYQYRKDLGSGLYSYKIFYHEIGSQRRELDPTDSGDLSILTDFIDNYIINNNELPVDDRISSVYIRNGQNLIYGYDRVFPQTSDLFEFISSEASVKSLGGKTGDITFDNNPGEGHVIFTINENNVLSGSVTTPASSAPTGIIAMWPCPDPSNPKAAPGGYLLCDGSNYSQTTYSELYGVIGNAYNDSTTTSGNFRVPDMRNIMIGFNYIIKI